MFSAILILLAMPFTDLSRSRGIQFRPLSKIAFYVFIGNFLILMQLGAKHVESPFIEFGQISTVIYFAHFLIIVPFISLFENSLIELPDGDEMDKSTSYNMIKNNGHVYSSVSKLSTILVFSILSYVLTFNTKLTDSCDTARP
jgi:ubiquinol-cytochrome c reductase cytochrome b subunit